MNNIIIIPDINIDKDQNPPVKKKSTKHKIPPVPEYIAVAEDEDTYNTIAITDIDGNMIISETTFKLKQNKQECDLDDYNNLI